MATLRDIRNRIVAVKSTAQITSAMRMVAAAKLRRAQEGITSAKPYALKLNQILANLAGAETSLYHPYFEKRKETKNTVLVVVSSDRGLCGSFNTNILKQAVVVLKELGLKFPKAKHCVIPVGRRATAFFSKNPYPVIQSFPDAFQKLEYSLGLQIAELVSDGFMAGKFDLVQTVGNEFKNILKQEIKIHQALPIIADQTKNKKANASDYIFEPSKEEILSTLLPSYLNMQIWKALLDSNAAEQAARMVAMESATNNAKDLIESLQLVYNKARQAAITTEMLEIVGGAEALKSA